jgi:hypothetical protein
MVTRRAPGISQRVRDSGVSPPRELTGFREVRWFCRCIAWRAETGHDRNYPLLLQITLRAGAHTAKYIHCSLANIRS